MGLNTEEVYALLANIQRQIKSECISIGYDGRHFLTMEEVELEDSNDPDEVQKRNALYGILQKLEDVSCELDYLKKPILRRGILQKNQNDRYELDGFELTSGNEIEILVIDPEGEEPAFWQHTYIEHDGYDYYAVYGHKTLEGIEARIR